MTDPTPPNPSNLINGASWQQDMLATTPTPPPRKHKLFKRLAVLTTIGITLVAIALVVKALLVPTPTCLTAEDFTELTGDTYVGDIDPKASFYDYTFTFLPDTTQYDPSEAANYESTVKKIGEFYQARATKPMVFTIRSYQLGDDESASIARMREESIWQSLVRMEIPSEIIEALPTTVGNNSGIEDDDGFDGSTDNVVLSITSAAACK